MADYVRADSWQTWGPLLLLGKDIHSATLGIIGFGRIGREMARRAVGFGMRTLYFSRTRAPSALEDELGATYAPLDELLAASDYVVVTVPYTPETDGMIGAEQIAQMKPGALLVGISRGKIIDEDALIAALKSGHLSAAALDVFSKEPLPEDSAWWDMDNVLVTPHAAGGTQLERQYLLDIFYENLERFFSGNLPLRNQIDKKLGF